MKYSVETGAGFAMAVLCVLTGLQTAEAVYWMEILKVAELAFSNINHAWYLLEPKLKPGSPYYQEKNNPEDYLVRDQPMFYVKSEEESLLARINEINRKISSIEESMRIHEENIVRKLQLIPREIMTEMKVNQVLDLIRDIEARYETFTNYVELGTENPTDDKPRLDRLTMENFALFTVSPSSDSPLSVLSKLHNLLIPHMDSDRLLGTKSFYYTFKDYLNAEDFTCDVNQSPQQMLFNLYTTFQLTQLKAYTMAHFSWMLLRIYNQGNFTVESERLKTSYLQRMSQQALAIKSVMRDSKNDLWACDPKQHVDGETFVKITKFLQGYIVNEVDLNGDNTCRENCAFYTYGKQQGCFKDQFCARQPPCRGSIVGCKFVDSDMHVCQAPHFSERRYDWIEYENGRTLGQRKQCNRAVQPVDSWWRYLFWHCSYCFCFCDDPKDGGSDRYFSLRSVTSDTAKNKVVTGMRFVKKGRIVHLQIQQGTLLPHGDINETTVEWVPVQEFDINGEGVEVGRDYHMLTWEHRALDLDDVTLPSGHILTGVKLRRIGGHLNLEIQGTQFNYTKGLLKHNGTRSQWFGNDNTDGALDQPRTMHKLKNPDAPDKSNGLNEVDSRPDTFIEFTSSDAELDVAQTAVPFIDIQPVAPKPPTALVGAGILHKGRPYSGGYVAPKLFTYNQGEHVHDHFPDLNEAEF